MKKLISIMLLLCLFAGLVPLVHAEDYSKIQSLNVSVYVDGNWKDVRAFSASYDNNIYLSARSLAEAFNGTSKAFDFGYSYTAADGSFFTITTGTPYAPVEIRNGEDPGFLELKRSRLFVDGNEKRYFTYRYGDPEDLYFSVVDLCLLFDMDAELLAKNAVWFKTDVPFSPNLQALDSGGYFDNMNCVLAGNAATGNVVFSKNADTSFAIASTSKLMTYLLVMEAVSSGKTSLDSIVTLSDNVQKMSESEDGLIEMKAGQTPTVSELLSAMLVASSNEAALALAEHICLSESAFVTQMNRRARSLGLSKTRFYNCNGLPFYTENVFPVKRQNFMSGSDLFSLTSYILNTFPEITGITSCQFAYFPTFDYNTANTNTLVFNVDSVNGLKTGNTKQAGCCLVASDISGNIVIVLGAEDNAVRGRVAQILFKVME